jgi:hypothetical protein
MLFDSRVENELGGYVVVLYFDTLVRCYIPLTA